MDTILHWTLAVLLIAAGVIGFLVIALFTYEGIQKLRSRLTAWMLLRRFSRWRQSSSS